MGGQGQPGHGEEEEAEGGAGEALGGRIGQGRGAMRHGTGLAGLGPRGEARTAAPEGGWSSRVTALAAKATPLAAKRKIQREGPTKEWWTLGRRVRGLGASITGGEAGRNL